MLLQALALIRQEGWMSRQHLSRVLQMDGLALDAMLARLVQRGMIRLVQVCGSTCTGCTRAENVFYEAVERPVDLSKTRLCERSEAIQWP